VFDSYVSDSVGWANIGRGTAGVLEVTRTSSGSVVVHAVGSFMHENGSGAVSDLQHETWTTVYPGGHVYIRRQLTTGSSAVSLSNLGGKAIDLSPASTWKGIFTGVASDTSYPNGTNAYVGTGSESWLGFWQGGTGAGQSMGVGVSSWQSQDFGASYSLVRLLVGSASTRSHAAQRTEQTVNLAANTTYSAQFSGWLSSQIKTAAMNAQVLDYRSPQLSVWTGTLASSDSEPVTVQLAGGFNPSTGNYVLGSTPSGVVVQPQFPLGLSIRYRPAFKITGWPGPSPIVQLAGKTLTAGVDYLADQDTTTSTLRLVMLKDFVAGSPLAGQLQSGVLAITPVGAPPPSPGPSQNPGAPVPGPLQTIQGINTIEVNDGTTFAAIFDRNQAGGISRLYDLATDPGRTANLGPQPGYTVFNSYLLDQQIYAPTTTLGVWGDIGGGPATTFEVLNQSPESTTIHVITPYYCEQVDAPGGQCFLNDVTEESWTTVYPGGHVFFERHIITGSTSHTLANAAPASVDLCLSSNLYGIFDGVPSDTSYPSPDDLHAGTGHERWWGQYQTGTGPGQSLGVLQVAYQDNSFGLSYADMRLIIGSAYLRSHITPRTEDKTTPVLTANTTYVARFQGWLSSLVNTANANSMTADYRQPALSVTKGTLLTVDSELNASGLTSGYNAGTGRYVVKADGSGTFQGQLGFPAGVSIRYRPSFKVVNWTGGPLVVRWGGTVLVAGTDYRASIDGTGALRVSLLFDVVAGTAGAGQKQNKALTIAHS
jgi:hypothetical protein